MLLILISFVVNMKRKREPEPEQGPNKQQKLNYSNILIAIVNNDIEAVKFHIAKDPELVFHQKPIGTQTFVHFAVTSTGIFRITDYGLMYCL